MCSLFRWPPGSAALLAAGMTAAALPYSYLLQLQLRLLLQLLSSTQVQRLPFLMLDVITGRVHLFKP